MMLKSHVGRKTRWLARCSTILVAGAMSTSASAQSTPETVAQEQAPSEASEQQYIIVTGTRIDRPGYESPTPLTRVSAEELAVTSQPNLGWALADLPQFKASTSPVNASTNANAGAFPIDIR